MDPVDNWPSSTGTATDMEVEGKEKYVVIRVDKGL